MGVYIICTQLDPGYDAEISSDDRTN